jgi:hypothetical protein
LKAARVRVIPPTLRPAPPTHPQPAFEASPLEKRASHRGPAPDRRPAGLQEDRKRLKEKLKSAFEAVQLAGGAGGGGRALLGARGGRPPAKPWLEYVFGICPPDQRIGKRGSRCAAEPARDWIITLDGVGTGQMARVKWSKWPFEEAEFAQAICG